MLYTVDLLIVPPTDTERLLTLEFGLNLIEIEYEIDPGMTEEVIYKFETHEIYLWSTGIIELLNLFLPIRLPSIS